MEKTCTECGLLKPFSDFHRFKRNKDGRQSRCKDCQAKRDRERWEARGREYAATLDARKKKRVLRKTCSRCREELPRSKFYNRARSPDGLTYLCKTCTQEVNRLSAQRKPAKYEAWRVEYARAWHHARKYGLEPEEYASRAHRQKDLCAICKQPTDRKSGFLDVDHCHECGIVRHLLCRRCNQTLGFVGDDGELLMKMARYLRKHNVSHRVADSSE